MSVGRADASAVGASFFIIWLLVTSSHTCVAVVAQNITTFAGAVRNPAQNVPNGDGRPAINAQLWKPQGLAITPSGGVIVVDVLDDRVRLVNAAGIITTIAGTGTTGVQGAGSGDGSSAVSAELGRDPLCVALSADGRLFISSGSRVRVVSVAGIINAYAGVVTAGFNGDGIQATAAQLNLPWGIALGLQGDLFIADTGNFRLRRVSATTGHISTVAANATAADLPAGSPALSPLVTQPTGITVDDRSGDVLIADVGSHRVLRLAAATGLITALAGSGAAGYAGDGGSGLSALLRSPYSMAIDPTSRDVVIADTGNNVVRRLYVATGLIATVAGTGTAGRSADPGPATSAMLSQPMYVTVGLTGAVFVADTFNNVVRMVAAPAALLPVAAPVTATPPLFSPPPTSQPPTPALFPPVVVLPAPVTLAPPSALPSAAGVPVSSRSVAGPVAGGVVGGVAGAALLLGVGLIWWRRRHPPPVKLTNSATELLKPDLCISLAVNPSAPNKADSSSDWPGEPDPTARALLPDKGALMQRGQADTHPAWKQQQDAWAARLSSGTVNATSAQLLAAADPQSADKQRHEQTTISAGRFSGSLSPDDSTPTSSWGNSYPTRVGVSPGKLGLASAVSHISVPRDTGLSLQSPTESWDFSAAAFAGISSQPDSVQLPHEQLYISPPSFSPSVMENSSPSPHAWRAAGTPTPSPHDPPDASEELQARRQRTGATDYVASPSGSPGGTHATKMNVGGVRWTQGALIDQGGSGRVYVGHDCNGALIGIKVQPMPVDTDQVSQDLLLQELNALQKLRHPNVVEYLGSAMDDANLYIFMAYESQSLARLLKNGLDESVVRRYTRQILLGLEYVHSQGIAHRDVKAANLLVDSEGMIKLTDFGSAKVHTCTDTTVTNANIHTIAGTPHWMSPEICLAAVAGQGGDGYSGTAADVWSLGVTVVEMMMGGHPWCRLEGLTAIWQVVNNVEGLPRPKHASPTALEFLDLCLQRDPHTRATVAQLLEHPFVAVQEDTQSVAKRRAAAPSVASPAGRLSRLGSTGDTSQRSQAALVSPTAPLRRTTSAAPTSPAAHPSSTSFPRALTTHAEITCDPPLRLPHAPVSMPNARPPPMPKAPRFSAPHLPLGTAPSAPLTASPRPGGPPSWLAALPTALRRSDPSSPSSGACAPEPQTSAARLRVAVLPEGHTAKRGTPPSSPRWV